MRTISEQELKDILDKHGKWLRNEEGGEKADLSSADLSSADLSYANLRSANLSSADLSSANLSYANLSSANLISADLSYANLRYANLRYANLRSADLSSANLIVFQFQQHWAYFTFDGFLRIGCIHMPISEWEIVFKEIGKKNGYTAIQTKMYGDFIKSCAEGFKSVELCRPSTTATDKKE
jgi:hypothetical protein